MYILTINNCEICPITKQTQLQYVFSLQCQIEQLADPYCDMF